jgi:hypothetical protein
MCILGNRQGMLWRLAYTGKNLTEAPEVRIIAPKHIRAMLRFASRLGVGGR